MSITPHGINLGFSLENKQPTPQSQQEPQATQLQSTQSQVKQQEQQTPQPQTEQQVFEVVIESMNSKGEIIYTINKYGDPYTFEVGQMEFPLQEGAIHDVNSEWFEKEFSERFKNYMGIPKESNYVFKIVNYKYSAKPVLSLLKLYDVYTVMIVDDWRIRLSNLIKTIKSLGKTDIAVRGVNKTFHWDMLITEAYTATLKIPTSYITQEGEAAWGYEYLLYPITTYQNSSTWNSELIEYINGFLGYQLDYQIAPKPYSGFSHVRFLNNMEEFAYKSIQTKAIINLIRYKSNEEGVKIIDTFYKVFQESRMAKQNKMDYFEIIVDAPIKELTLPKYLKSLFGINIQEIYAYIDFKSGKAIASGMPEWDESGYISSSEYTEDEVTNTVANIRKFLDEYKSKNEGKISLSLLGLQELYDYLNEPLEELLKRYKELEEEREVIRERLFLDNYYLLYDTHHSREHLITLMSYCYDGKKYTIQYDAFKNITFTIQFKFREKNSLDLEYIEEGNNVTDTKPASIEIDASVGF